MSGFKIYSIASGSSGNAYYAESRDGAVIIDAGVSAKRIAEGIQAVGGHIDRVDGIILTHDHSDHIRGAAVLSRRHRIPLFMTPGTFQAARSEFQRIASLRAFRSGAGLCLGGFHIHSISTPHDGMEPVALVLERKGHRVGVLTDLGHVFAELERVMSTLDAAVLESNYDPRMLASGPYPANLKARIRSDAGHISNAEAATLVRDHGGDRLRQVMLAHLSETNNHPRVALATFQEIAQAALAAGRLRLAVAPRHQPSEPIFVGSQESPAAVG